MTISADGLAIAPVARRLPKGYDLAPPIKSKEELDEERRAAWLESRRGVITASNFHLLLGRPQNKATPFSKGCQTYLNQVVAERLGSQKFEASAPSTRWGHDNEPKAVEIYQRRVARTAGKVDYDPYRLVRNRRWPDVGGSPDALVGAVGILEIKCPYDPAVHVRTLTDKTIPPEYLGQVLGHLLNDAKREWCDFVSCDPRLEGTPAELIALRVTRQSFPVEYARLKQQVENAVDYVEARTRELSRVTPGRVGGKVVLRGDA